MEEMILTRTESASRKLKERRRRCRNFGMFVAFFLGVGILSNIVYATLIKQNSNSFFTLREVGIDLMLSVTIGYLIFIRSWKRKHSKKSDVGIESKNTLFVK